MLYEFQHNVWILDGNLIHFKTMPILPKTVIIKLENGNLWVHSPITLTTQRLDLIKPLGEVHYLVAPNKYHYQGVDDWKKEFPMAQLWVSPDAPKHLPKIHHDHVIDPNADNYPWSGEIDQVLMAGNRFLDEIFFIHKPSKTLIVTDWIHRQDPTKEVFPWTYIKKGLNMVNPNGGVPRHIKRTLTNKDLGRKSINTVLSWDFDSVIVGHGSCVEHNGRDHVKEVFAWLYG